MVAISFLTPHNRLRLSTHLRSNGTNSWRNMIRQGATTTMEAWTEDEKPNLTYSHAWGATPADVIPRYLVGALPTTPG